MIIIFLLVEILKKIRNTYIEVILKNISGNFVILFFLINFSLQTKYVIFFFFIRTLLVYRNDILKWDAMIIELKDFFFFWK